jgi:glyoxylase-like metal-dependent hydrolase (beta-lactamase superfamily II)
LRRAGVPELLMHARDWQRAQTLTARRLENDRAADAWLARNGFVARNSADEGLGARWELSEPTRLLGDGERAGRLTAIWTPGHSPGHLCLVDGRSGRMFTGDHILKPITPHVGLWNDGDGDPMGDSLASLNKVRGRGASGALPAHGEPFPNHDRRIDELLAHAEQRDGQIISALRTGATTAAEVAQRLPWTRRNRSFDDLGEWDRQFAISETIAHLHHLSKRGLITRDAASDPIHYRA